MQWRADFTGTAELDSVTIAYLPQKTAPSNRSIHGLGATNSGERREERELQRVIGFSLLPLLTPATPRALSAPRHKCYSRPSGQQLQISWQADDPDGDKLSYSLYFRGEDEHDWKLLRADISENTYLLDGDVLADGRYFFRVIASDRPSNPAEQARQAEMIGPPVLIDNTPPVVTASAARRSGAVVDIDVDAQDRGSILRRCRIFRRCPTPGCRLRLSTASPIPHANSFVFISTTCRRAST